MDHGWMDDSLFSSPCAVILDHICRPSWTSIINMTMNHQVKLVSTSSCIRANNSIFFFWPCASYLSTKRAQWIGNREAGNQLRGIALPMASLAQHKRSVTYCVVVDRNIVSWRSKKQAVVSRSTIQAEHRAMALALCEMMWLKDLLKKLSGVEEWDYIASLW